MEIAHVWEIKATLESTRTNFTYDVNAKVVTKEKSFSEAEKAGMEFVRKIIQEEKNHCTCEALDDISYISRAGTLIGA